MKIKDIFHTNRITCASVFMIILVSCLLVNTHIYSQTNLISNGDFEQGLTGWTVWGANMNLTTDARSGNSAVKISNRKNTWDALVRNVTALIESNKTYEVEVWVKLSNPAADFWGTLALNVGGNTSYHAFLRPSNYYENSFRLFVGEITPSWSGNLISANIYFETNSVGGSFPDYIVDDVSMILAIEDPGNFIPGTGLKDIKSPILIGGAVTEGGKNYFTNLKAKNQVLHDCNAVQVQCYPAWGRWDESKKHVYHLDEFSSQIREMKDQNMIVTAHMLFGWDKYFPEWFRKNDFHADTLDSIMKSWIHAIITHQGNDTLVDIWNVVNEAITWDEKGSYWPINAPNFESANEFHRLGFEPDASGLTGNQFVNSQHPIYIRQAFEYARTLTDKKLELRESWMEFPTDGKYRAFYQLAVHLKNMNAPVDVIGFQNHLSLNQIYDWNAYTENIRRYVKLGYQVNITEVDIGDVDLYWTEEKAELQKLYYYRMLAASIKGGASEFQTWGFNDDNNQHWRFGQSAFPYTYKFEPKPAYYGIREALIDMSPVIYWEMDQLQDGKIPNVNNYPNTGTLNNFSSPIFENGFLSKALKINGGEENISSPVFSESIDSGFTFSCFIKTDSNQTGVVATFSNTDDSMVLSMNDEGFVVFKAGDREIKSPLPVNDTEWHFIAIQRDADNYKLFIDGLIPEDSLAHDIVPIDQLIIGANSTGSISFNGLIDEVKLFDSAVETASFQRNMIPYFPLQLKLSRNGMKITLTWRDQSINESGFIIERRTENDDWIEVKRVNANMQSYTDEVILYNTKYTYRLRAFNKFGISNPSVSQSIITPDNPVNIIDLLENNNQNKTLLYPNPGEDFIYILTDMDSHLKLYDVNGRLILEKNNIQKNEKINISELPGGIYFIKIFHPNREEVIKLIKQ